MQANLEPRQQPEDADLIASCLAGEIDAFATLIDRHRARVERLLRVLIRDRFVRDDVWQETLLRAYFHLDQLRDRQRFAAWLCTIAANQARTQHNPQHAQTLSWERLGEEGSYTLAQQTGVAHSPEELVEQGELARRVRQAINDLPLAEREAVLLVYLDGLSHREVATHLGTTLSAVKVRVHRGRRRLQVSLRGDVEQSLSRTGKEGKMIRVQVHDVLRGKIDQPEVGELPAVLVAAPDQESHRPHRLILLKEEAGERVLPIWVGSIEGDLLAMHLLQQESKRPMTYELFKTLLELGQVGVEQVTVARLVENTFYSNLLVRTANTTVEVDCRPSDAINLAVRIGVPILVAEEVMAQAGKTLGEPLESEIEWESVLRVRTAD